MHKMGIFPVRQAVERLRAGLFDPVAVDRLTMEEEAVTKRFAEGLKALEYVSPGLMDRENPITLLICIGRPYLKGMQ